MGINTGFCNVGNFGSAGAEVNLAARLQSITEPGSIVMSYETYALARDIVHAHPLPPLSDPAIGREVIPYAFEYWLDAAGDRHDRRILSEHMPGLGFYLDHDLLDPASVVRVRTMLASAIAALDGRAQNRSA